MITICFVQTIIAYGRLLFIIAGHMQYAYYVLIKTKSVFYILFKLLPKMQKPVLIFPMKTRINK